MKNNIKLNLQHFGEGSTKPKTWEKPLSDEAITNTLQQASDDLGVEIDATNIDLTGYTASDLVMTINKVIVINQLFKPKWKYHLIDIFGLTPTINGIKSYDYMDFTDGDARNARDDNSIDDFNGEFETILREAFEVDKEWHKKAKLPELILSDAWATANEIVGFVSAQREAVVKSLEKNIEQELWRKVVKHATTIDVTGNEINLQEAMFKQLQTYETTSIQHLGIGTGGIIDVDTNGQGAITTVQPSLYFESSDFYLIETPGQSTSITFDGDATYFNWNATATLLAGRKVIDFEIYEGMDQKTKDALKNGQVVLIHKTSLDPLEFFNYQSVVKGASAFEIMHTFEEYGVYYRKQYPILIFTLTPTKKVAAKRANTKKGTKKKN